ncbi:hypothetical protein T11_15697 [Trichinella zimbabwensis]|uniref:Uncharacterized protein n=1 Tax=Trichinella zimbabwensis TaxID=268475 RepID=A0A0V1HRM9_9BILA|nr:hypothetical protein T11_15697 [Trichinella zimbabwensis]
MQPSLMRKASFIDNVSQNSQISTGDDTTRYRCSPNAVAYMRIHSHRKMHRLFTTLWPNSNTAMNEFAIIQRLVAIAEDKKGLQKSHCLNLTINKSSEVQAIRNSFGVIREVDVFFMWFFKRSTALKTFIEKQIAESTLKNQKYSHLKMLYEIRWVEQHNAVLTFFNLYRPLVETLQHITSGRTAALPLKQCSYELHFIISLAVLTKVLSLTLPLSKNLQDSRLDLLQYCDEGDLIFLPRNISRQMNRSNFPKENRQYYRLRFYDKFLQHRNNAMRLSALIPRFLDQYDLSPLKHLMATHLRYIDDQSEAH